MAEIWFEFSTTRDPLADSVMFITLNVDETVRGRPGHLPSYAEAKELMLLTLCNMGASGLAYVTASQVT